MLCVRRCHHWAGWTRTIADQENIRASWALNSQLSQQLSGWSICLVSRRSWVQFLGYLNHLPVSNRTRDMIRNTPWWQANRDSANLALPWANIVWLYMKPQCLYLNCFVIVKSDSSDPCILYIIHKVALIRVSCVIVELFQTKMNI